MTKKSLPLTLYKTLEHHARDADIEDNEELKEIMVKLNELNEKVEAFKQKARDKKVEKADNVIPLKTSR
jgi:hypothetical protein